MKSGTSKTTTTNSVPIMATTTDDLSDPNNLRAIHSIEAILGFKKGDSHHQQQHLFASHLLPSPLQLHQHNKKRNSDGHYPDSKSKLPKINFLIYFFLFRSEINSSC
jgi:hypothetical protein